MIITKKHIINKKVALFMIITAVALVLLTIYIYAFKGSLFGWAPFQQSKAQGSTNLSQPTQSQLNSGAAIKSNSLKDSSSSGSSGSDQPPAPVQQSNSAKSIVETTITSIIQTPSSLQVGTQIAGVFSTGTCMLTLSKQGEQDIVKIADIQPLASTSTCKGFSITDKLAVGTWNLSLVYDSATITGTATATKVIQ